MYQKHIKDLDDFSQERYHTPLRADNTIYQVLVIVSLLGNQLSAFLRCIEPRLKSKSAKFFQRCSCSAFPRVALLIIETNNKDLEKKVHLHIFPLKKKVTNTKLVSACKVENPSCAQTNIILEIFSCMLQCVPINSC